MVCLFWPGSGEGLEVQKTIDKTAEEPGWQLAPSFTLKEFLDSNGKAGD